MHAHPKAGARVDIAEVFRRFGPAYRAKHDLPDQAGRVLRDLEQCRTAALGEHLYHCNDCGRDVPLYNSCLNRHCPTCQGPAQYHWIAQRQQRLLNTGYFHVVFTLPALLRPVVLAHRRLLFKLLFHSVSETLHTFGRDPRWLGAQIGFTLVLHTWTRELLFHPHLHAIVPGGGLSADGRKWVPPADSDFLFPVAALSKVFRGKFLSGLIDLCTAGKIDLTQQQSRELVRESKKHPWVVFAKKPFGGPQQIVNYLGRYTHRVAISSARLLSIDEHKIVFRTRGDKTCTLTPEEFVRRFLLHVLPHQFFKIRHYGLLAPANVNTRLRRAQELLGPLPAQVEQTADHSITDNAVVDAEPEATENDRSAPKCPHCGGRLTALSTRRVHRVGARVPDT